MGKRATAIVGLLTVLFTCGGAGAAGPAVDFGLGVTRLSLSEPLLDSSTSAGVQIGFSFSPWRERAELRLGLHLSASSYDEDRRFPIPAEPELFMVTGRFSELNLAMPEVRLSWRQPVNNFFIEPGIGLGVVVARYEAGDTRLGVFGHFDEVLVRRTRSGFGVRPMVRAGYHYERWDFGVEASYLMAQVRVGETRRVRELYVGGFVRWFLN